MKKILLTTALVGSLVSGMSVANAQTKVSGNLGISYFATSNETSSETSGSYNGFGTESQINISSSGDLNNGMKYAAGFSWEIDGTETLGSMNGSLKGGTEGTYIEFISGGTTFGVGADRDTSIDGLGVNFAGFGYRSIDGIATTITNTTYGTNAGFGFHANQKFDGGSFAVAYVPNTGDKATTDIGSGASKSNIDGGESYYSATYKGKIGGFNLVAGVNTTTGVATFSDQDAMGGSIAYTMGKTKLGVSYGEFEKTAAAGASAVKNETTEIGIAHAVSDNTTVGLTYTTTDTSVANKTEEEIITASVGYNLGAISVQLQYKDASDIGGTTGVDAQQLGMYIGTKF
jgi:hypothetical protein